MAEAKYSYSRLQVFSRILPVLLVVALLFQLLLAKDTLSGLEAVWTTIQDSLLPSLGVSLIASGVLALIYGNNLDKD